MLTQVIELTDPDDQSKHAVLGFGTFDVMPMMQPGAMIEINGTNLFIVGFGQSLKTAESAEAAALGAEHELRFTLAVATQQNFMRMQQKVALAQAAHQRGGLVVPTDNSLFDKLRAGSAVGRALNGGG